MEIEESKFYCSAEWHLVKMGSLCAAVYSWSLKIAGKSKRFAVSEVDAGLYFGRHRNTILTAYKKLSESGFFKLIYAGKNAFESNVYEPIKHEQWAKEHPNCCLKREVGLTLLNDDKLGQDLYAASGTKIKFKDFRIKWYRRLGFSDNEIVEYFREWFPGYASQQSGKKWRTDAAQFHFGERLTALRQRKECLAKQARTEPTLVSSI